MQVSVLGVDLKFELPDQFSIRVLLCFLAGRGNNEDLEGVVTDRYHKEGIHQAGQREETALRLAASKKVTFQSEQLAFCMNVDNAGVFAGEQPAPFTVSNLAKGGRKKSKERKRSTSAKKVRPASASGKQTYDQKQTNKYKKSIAALKKKIGAKDKPKPLEQAGWNDSTAIGKYFDVNIDAREKRAVQAKQNE